MQFILVTAVYQKILKKLIRQALYLARLVTADRQILLFFAGVLLYGKNIKITHKSRQRRSQVVRHGRHYAPVRQVGQLFLLLSGADGPAHGIHLSRQSRQFIISPYRNLVI